MLSGEGEEVAGTGTSGMGFILFKESKIEWKGLGSRNYLFRNPTNADYSCLTIFFIPSSSCMCMGMPSAICQVPLRRSKGSVVELVLSPATVWLLGVEFRLPDLHSRRRPLALLYRF